MKKTISLCSSLLVLLSSLAYAAAPKEEKKPVRPLEIGAAAVDFHLPGVDGKSYSLKDFADAKILIVLFTCNHCPTAQAYEERIKKLVVDYEKKGVALVAISPNDDKAVRLDELGYTDLGDSFEDMKIRAKHAKYNFPYLYDGETQKTSRAYGPKSTPQVFIFDAYRTLRYTGRIDSTESGRDIKTHDAREALDTLLEGKLPATARTRAFGCSIKWSDKREANRRFMKELAAEKVTLEPIDVKGVKALRANASKKLRMINVWATWCGPCRVEFPDLVASNRMYRHRAFEFISISLDLPEKSKEVLPFLQKQQASSKNYLYNSDDRDAFADALEKEWSGAMPLTLLVKPGGELLYRHEGQVDPLELRRAIVAYLGRTYR